MSVLLSSFLYGADFVPPVYLDEEVLDVVQGLFVDCCVAPYKKDDRSTDTNLRGLKNFN